MLIPSVMPRLLLHLASLSRRVNANSQLLLEFNSVPNKLIKKGEC